MILHALRRQIPRRTFIPTITATHISTPTATSPLLFQQITVTPVNTRPFSTSSTIDDLSSIVAREISEEADNTSLPPSLAELKSTIEQDWTIADTIPGSASSAVVKMYKTTSGPSGAKVTIMFHCQDTMTDPNDEGNDIETVGEDPDAEEEEEEEVALALRFRVTVSKAGKSMIFGCVSDEGEVTLESLVVREDENQSEAEMEYDSKLYQGPEFSELPEDFQESMTTFLAEDCGIDNDVAAFISMYADYKEQVEYMNWLKTLQSCLK